MSTFPGTPEERRAALDAQRHAVALVRAALAQDNDAMDALVASWSPPATLALVGFLVVAMQERKPEGRTREQVVEHLNFMALRLAQQ